MKMASSFYGDFTNTTPLDFFGSSGERRAVNKLATRHTCPLHLASPLAQYILTAINAASRRVGDANKSHISR